MTEDEGTIRRGRSTATGGRGIVSPLFLAVTAALSGFGLWVWITGPGTSVLVALVGFVIAVACGRMAFSAMAKPAQDDDEIPNKLTDLPPDPPMPNPLVPDLPVPDPLTTDAQADVADGAAGPAEEPRGVDAPPVPEGSPPTLDGAVVDPPPLLSTVIPFPIQRATENDR